MRSLRRSQRKLKSKLRSKSFSPQRRRSFFGGERRLRVFQKIAPTEIDNLLPALVQSALQALRHKDQKDFIFFRDKAVKMYGAKAVKQEATRQRSFDSA